MKIQSIEAAEKYVFRRRLTTKERNEWESKLKDLLKDLEKICRCIGNDTMYFDYYPAEKHHQFTSDWLNGNGIPIKIDSYYFLLKQAVV